MILVCQKDNFGFFKINKSTCQVKTLYYNEMFELLLLIESVYYFELREKHNMFVL